MDDTCPGSADLSGATVERERLQFMKNSDGVDAPTLRECGYAYLTFEENETVLFQILGQIGLVWRDNEEEKERGQKGDN